MDSFDTLNGIYKPLCDKASTLCQGLKQAGYEVRLAFHNNHSVKRNDTFATEYFPIPVIFIEGLGSIGVDIDTVWLEAVLTKEHAMRLSYPELVDKYKIELYGSDDFLCDLYNEQMDVSQIAGRIASSSEVSICVLFYLSMDASCGEVIEIARLVA